MNGIDPSRVARSLVLVPRLSTPLALLALAVTLLFAPQPAAAQAPAAAAGLAELPQLPLERMEEAVRQRLAAARDEVQRLRDAGAEPAALAEGYGRLGWLCFSYQLDEAAATTLANARQLAPSSLRWAYLAGVVAQRQRRLQAAEAAFEQVLALNPDYLPALLRLGQVLLLVDRDSEAEERFSAALVIDPDSAAAHYGLGLVAVAAGDVEAAVERFELVLSLQPEASAVRQQLGLAYRELGDLERARSELQQAGNRSVRFSDPLAEAPLPSSQDAMTAGAAAYEAGRYGDAVAAYQQAVAAQPDNATYRQALAAALIRSGDREAGLAEYRQVLRRDPDNALARLRLAVVRAEDEGPSPEVLEELSRVVESAPELVEARLELGRLLVEAGRPAEALPHLQRAVEAAPEDLEARQRYGRLLLSLQRLPEARRELEAALELGGDDAETLLALGLLEKAAGDAEAARRYLLQVVEQEVDAPRRAGLALVQLARLAEERGDAAEALTHWQAAAELTPRALTVQLGLSAARVAGGLVAEAVAGLEEAVAAADDDQNRAVLLFNLGVLRQRQGEVGAAADAYRRAVELAPGMDEAQFNLAALLLGQGRFDSAADRFQRVLEANPADGAARRGLALAYQRAGRWSEARAALEAGLEASPGDVVLSHQLARLLAVCPQEEVRDPARALELASAALDEQATLPRVETFAMALAAAGRFDEAVEWQQRLLSEAEGAGVPEAELRRLRRNLERYQRGEAAEASS